MAVSDEIHGPPKCSQVALAFHRIVVVMYTSSLFTPAGRYDGRNLPVAAAFMALIYFINAS